MHSYAYHCCAANGRCAMGVRWAVELVDGSSVRAQIRPMPVVTASMLAEEERLAHKWLVAQIPPAIDMISSDEEDHDEGGEGHGEGQAYEDNETENQL